MSNPANKSRASRIPATLQAIFLASNRGKDVHKPPPKSVANKVYFSNWLFQRNTSSKKKTGHENKLTTQDFDKPDAKPQARTRRPLESKSNSAKQLLSPQVYLDAMLRSRGYSTKRYESLNSAYYNKPTPHQRASYDVHLIQVIRQRDEKQFAKVMAHGLSSNPCNQFSETVAHTVCRHGNIPMLKVLMERGCDFRVVDDYGRTPLHDACWAAQPAFNVAKEIIQIDIRMFHLIDARGHCPLNYVRKEHYGEWIDFLEANKDAWWPKRSIKTDGEQGPPALILEPPNSRPVQDPADSFSLELSSMVASGRMKPDEAWLLHEAENATVAMSEEDDDVDSEYSTDDDDDSDYDSDEEENENELSMFIQGLPVTVRAAA